MCRATAGGRNGLAALEQAMPAIWTMLAADMVGAAEWQLQTTVEYVGTRQQFDHPLGFFQAVKHPLVDVMIQIDEAKSLVYNAACAIDSEPERAAADAPIWPRPPPATPRPLPRAARCSATAVLVLPGSVTCTCISSARSTARCCWAMRAWHRARLADIVIGQVA